MWGSRPTATRISSASTALAAARARRSTPAPPASTRSTWAPVRTSTPKLLAQRRGDFLAGEGLLAREQVLAALDQGHLRPERRPGLGELAADRAAAEHDHALRDLLRGGRVAVVPGLDRVEAVDRRHRRAAAGGDDDRLARRSGRRRRPTTRRSPSKRAGAAEEVDLAFFQPGQLDRVVEVVDHLVAAGEDRLRVELAVAADRHARACVAPRRAASAGRSSAFEGMQA